MRLQTLRSQTLRSRSLTMRLQTLRSQTLRSRSQTLRSQTLRSCSQTLRSQTKSTTFRETIAELEGFLLTQTYDHVIIAGDFNVDFVSPNRTNLECFMQAFDLVS